MDSIKRRYTTPAAPPPLINRPVDGAAAGRPPLFTFRGGAAPLRSGPSMVTFGWGPVILSRTHR
jgi:hypothetical protein